MLGQTRDCAQKVGGGRVWAVQGRQHGKLKTKIDKPRPTGPPNKSSASRTLSKSSSLGARNSRASDVCSSCGLWCTSALTRRRCRSANRMKAGCEGAEGGRGGGGGETSV